MAKKEKQTRVVFRTITSGISKGEVIALFIDDIADYHGNIMSYMHIGQHAAANYNACVGVSKLSTPQEYEPLLSELKSIGYSDLKIVKRRNT